VRGWEVGEIEVKRLLKKAWKLESLKAGKLGGWEAGRLGSCEGAEVLRSK
jgi:hypothetical protein